MTTWPGVKQGRYGIARQSVFGSVARDSWHWPARRPELLDRRPGKVEHLPSHRGCDFANVAGHTYGVCSCTGFDDYWDRNAELERQQVWG